MKNENMGNEKILKDFEQSIRSEGRAPDTIEQQTQQVKLFLERVNRNIDQITKTDIEQYINFLKSPDAIKTKSKGNHCYSKKSQVPYLMTFQ